MQKTAFSSGNDNEHAEAKNDKPLTEAEAIKLLSRVPLKIIKLTAGAPALSKDETSAMIESKKGSKNCQESILRGTKFFFRTTLAGPAFEHRLSRKKDENDNGTACFIWFFRGDKSDNKLNESSAALSYVVLSVKKKRQRKKDKGKSHEFQCDGSSLSAALKCVFTYFARAAQSTHWRISTRTQASPQ